MSKEVVTPSRLPFIRKKQPWSRYFLKVAVISVLISAGLYAFMDRYYIGLDPQKVKCIPGITFYLIDKKNQVVEKDKTYAFYAKGLDPIFEDGTKMVKFVRGVGGDKIKITEDQFIYINGEDHGFGFWLSERLGKKPSDFAGEGTIPTGEFWMMGTSDLSFDSRYWGTIHEDQIIGRAYPLF